MRNGVIDKASGWMAALAITSALFARSRGAGGQHIDLSMLDTAVQFLWPDGGMADTLLDPEASEGRRLSTLYRLTPCADGHIVYFVVSDKQFHGLYRALGRTDWIDHPQWGTHEGRRGLSEELGALLEEEFARWKVADLVPRMHENSVPCGEVAAVEDLHDRSPDPPQRDPRRVGPSDRGPDAPVPAGPPVLGHPARVPALRPPAQRARGGDPGRVGPRSRRDRGPPPSGGAVF